MRRWISWAAALGILLGAVYGLYPDDETRLRKEWGRLLALGRKEPGASLLAAAQTARSVQGFFTSNAVIALGGPYPATIGRSEWPVLISRAWHVAEHIQVRDLGHDLTMDEGTRTARMAATLELQVRVGGEDSRYVESYQVDWRTEDGNWRIHQVSRLETIRNPSTLLLQ